MDSSTLIIVILILLVLFICSFMLSKKYLNSKTLVLYVFSKFDKGNFILVDKDNNEILKVMNEPNKSIPIVKIYNQDGFFDSIYNKSELGLG